MATFNLAADTNIDALTSKGGGDVYNLLGYTLTIDQDSRYGANQSSTASIGALSTSATLGGTLEVDARFVRLIPYDGGSGTVPAAGTAISGGGASGTLICVLSALNATPKAAADAMPGTGWIKVKGWNSVAFADNTTLSGISATVNGTDTPGPISIVADEAGTITGHRLGLLRFRGDWLDLGTTDGSRATTYQIPTQGEAVYIPGVQVETSVAGVFEWYPNATSQAATLANIGTEAARGKVCWIDSSGVVRFGHDGTNSTGGYCPPTGRKVRLGSIFLSNCTTGARGTNAVPNATLGTRFEFAVTQGGALVMDKVVCGWYMNLSQIYSLSLTDNAFSDNLTISEVATAPSVLRNCVGPTQTQSVQPLQVASVPFGSTFTGNVFARYAMGSSNLSIASYTDCDALVASGNIYRHLSAKRGATTAAGCTLGRVTNSSFDDEVCIGASFGGLTGCLNVTITDLVYIDVQALNTSSTNPMPAVNVTGAGNRLIKVDGVTFGGIEGVAPMTSLLHIVAGNAQIKLRNVGSPSSPLNCGGPRKDGVSWSRSTTTATVNDTAHGRQVGDTIYVIISSSVAAITVAAKTVATVPDANSFTFTCLNAGDASGTLSYYAQFTAGAVSGLTGQPVVDTLVQRVYLKHTRAATGFDNMTNGLVYESMWQDPTVTILHTELNSTAKGAMFASSYTAQSAVYGTHFLDHYTTSCPANTAGVSWSRSTTTATVTSAGHLLRTGDRIVVTVTSSASAISLGVKTITVLADGSFTFTCANAGDASGTLTFVTENGRLVILGNETSAQTAAQVTLDAGTPKFTAAGSIYMPSVNDQATWEWPHFVLGHSSFPVDEAVMAGGTITNHDLTYAIDQGAGYSAWRNLSYPRIGAGGSNGSTTVTMTSTTGVAVGDYVFGTNIAPLAKVESIDSDTAITVSIANTGTVSGILRFNYLPNETISAPSTGFRIKVRVKTTTTNTAAWSSLYVWTNTGTADRAHQYVLDTSTVTVTNVVAGSRVRITKESDGTVLVNEAAGSSTFVAQVEYTGSVRIELRKASAAPYYKPWYTIATVGTGLSVTALQERDDQ